MRCVRSNTVCDTATVRFAENARIIRPGRGMLTICITENRTLAVSNLAQEICQC